MPSLFITINLNFRRLSTLVSEERARLLEILMFLFEGVYSPSGYLGKVTVVHCDTPWAFLITFILCKYSSEF